MQGVHRGQKSSSPTRGWPNRSWGPYDFESAIGFDTPSNTNARRPSKSQVSICVKPDKTQILGSSINH